MELKELIDSTKGDDARRLLTCLVGLHREKNPRSSDEQVISDMASDCASPFFMDGLVRLAMHNPQASGAQYNLLDCLVSMGMEKVEDVEEAPKDFADSTIGQNAYRQSPAFVGVLAASLREICSTIARSAATA